MTVSANEKMKELSGLFKTVFTAAKNMQAVHIGFPSRSPLALKRRFSTTSAGELRAFGIKLGGSTQRDHCVGKTAS
jgi:hypothetical protein